MRTRDQDCQSYCIRFFQQYAGGALLWLPGQRTIGKQRRNRRIPTRTSHGSAPGTNPPRSARPSGQGVSGFGGNATWVIPHMTYAMWDMGLGSVYAGCLSQNADCLVAGISQRVLVARPIICYPSYSYSSGTRILSCEDLPLYATGSPPSVS